MLQAGQQIGNHVTVRLLGRGGFADVYLGQHITLKLERAIKLLRNNLQDEEYQKFRREAHIIAALEHPHIVRIIDYAVWNDLPYIIMDYAPNGTMRHRHKRGSVVPPLTVLSYVRDVGDGLAFAHQKRVVHCDIKPENILIGRRGDVLVSDFGIATILQTATSSLQAAMQSGEVEEKKIVGTLPYMSPEQLRGKRVPASDQYALAVMSYEWLCGRTPFIGNSIALMFQHEHDAPSPVSRFKPDLPSALDDVLLTALEKQPGRRFPDIAHFVEAFERAVQPVRPRERRPVKHIWEVPIAPPEPMHQTEKPVAANTHQSIANEPLTLLFPEMTKDTETQPVSPPIDGGEYETAALKRKGGISRRALLGVGAGVLVGGGALAVTNLVVPMWSAAGQGQGTAGTGQGTATGKNVTPTTTRSILGTIVKFQNFNEPVNALAWFPKTTLIALASEDNVARVWDIGTNNTYEFPGHGAALLAVVWSPNGKLIASGSLDNTIKVWDVAGGNLLFTCTGHTARVFAISWSPDGKTLASGSADNTVKLWDATNGQIIDTYANHTNWIRAVEWSPDGALLATGGHDNTIHIWKPTTKQIIYKFVDIGKVYYALAWSPDSNRIASGTYQGTVEVWNALDGKDRLKYAQHSDSVFTVAWSPDKRKIASGCADSTVHVWNSSDGTGTYNYRGHREAVNTLAWSSDSKSIASGSVDKTILVWTAT